MRFPDRARTPEKPRNAGVRAEYQLWLQRVGG
jgi:hypothetical protein